MILNDEDITKISKISLSDYFDCFEETKDFENSSQYSKKSSDESILENFNEEKEKEKPLHQVEKLLFKLFIFFYIMKKPSKEFDVNVYYDENLNLKHYLIVKGVKRINEFKGNHFLSIFYISFFLKEENIIKNNIVSNNHYEIQLTLMEWFIFKLNKQHASLLLIINKIGYVEVYFKIKISEPFMKITHSQIEKNCIKIYDGCWLNDIIILLNQNLEILAFNSKNEIIFFRYADSNNLLNSLKMNFQKTTKKLNQDSICLIKNEEDV